MTAVSLEKFNSLPRDQQLDIHKEMKKSMGINGILKKWNLTRSKYYYLVKKLKLNDNNHPEPENITKGNSEAAAAPNRMATDNVAPLEIEETPISLAYETYETREKMSFSLSIQESPQVVNAILKSLEDMLHTSNSNYNVNITIREV